MIQVHGENGCLLYTSEFTFFLYFLVRDPFFWVSLVLFGTCLSFGIITLRTYSVFWPVLFFMASFFFGSASFGAIAGVASHGISKHLELEQEIRFLIEIGDVKPGINILQWDIVASRMNDYLFETGHYFGKYAFYDGRHCCNEFKEKYLLPRKDAFDVTPLNDSVHGENGGFDYFKRQVSKDYYDSFDEHLAKVHEESLKSRCAEV